MFNIFIVLFNIGGLFDQAVYEEKVEKGEIG